MRNEMPFIAITLTVLFFLGLAFLILGLVL